MLTKEWLDQLPLSVIQSIQPVSGGDINDSYRVETSEGPFFLLVQPNHDASFYAHEVEGLTLLSQAALVPEVIATGQISGDAYLILNWVDTGQGSQSALGEMVAHVHQIHQDRFGFNHDVLNVKLPKINTWQSDWPTFYLTQRLDVLVKRAENHQLWNSQRDQHYAHLRAIFESYYKDRSIVPSLLHGDLWSGNYLFTSDGNPMLIDPDVFYGDRELDLAMTTIFGGFDENFYSAYTATYPLEPDFKERLPWYQFYYLVAHLNLFGEMYGGAVDQILNHY